jgi:outer membrane protein TolC
MYALEKIQLARSELADAIQSIDRAAARFALGRPDPTTASELQEARGLLTQALARESRRFKDSPALSL